jgi:malonate transporter
MGMADIFGALFPIFALIVVGFACGRVQWFGQDSHHVLNGFVANLALPVLTFHILATMDARDLMEPVMFTVVVGASLIVYTVHFAIESWRGQGRGEANAAAFAASYGNHAFIGLPMCLAILGPASLAPAAVIIALNSTILFALGTLSAVMTSPNARVGRSRMDGVKMAVSLASRNPLLIAALAGALVAVAALPLPQPVDKLLITIGATTTPCALIAVGLFMARPVPQAGGTGATMRSVAGKLLLLPVVTAGLLWVLPPQPTIIYQTLLLIAAVPSGAGCLALARYGGDGALRMTARIITISTICAGLSLPILMLVMGLGA